MLSRELVFIRIVNCPPFDFNIDIAHILASTAVVLPKASRSIIMIAELPLKLRQI